MSGQINLQADVGQLSLQALGAVSTVLATLSADNVHPMAMLQMRDLGASFPTSGKYAAQVPDLLQRCNSIRLERVSALVGWRRGDAASLMADSAGGQAIALLVTALRSLCQTGDVLLGLSQELLPGSNTLASGSQLGEVATRLSTKLAPLGFGNLIAQQMCRIHDAYQQLKKPMPDHLAEVMTTESVVDLLSAISRALRDEDLVVRISGTRAMGNIVALVMFMFPQDCCVTVYDIVICAGPKEKILVEVGNGEEDRPTEIKVETLFRISQETPSPIIIKPRDPRVVKEVGYFTWEGFVADRLQLDFFDQGVKCTEELLITIAGLLLVLPAEMQSTALGREDQPFPRKGLISLLGSHPKHRMSQICEKILRIPPIEPPSEFEEAWKALVRVFQSVTETRVSCSCSSSSSKCNPSQGWRIAPATSKTAKGCRFYYLWISVANALDTGLLAFFVEAGMNAAIPDTSWRHGYSLGLATEFVTKKITRETFYRSCQELHQGIMGLAAGALSLENAGSELACSRSSTIYSRVLETMSLDRDHRAIYYLIDGQLLFKDRYHCSLRTLPPTVRPRANRSLYAPNGVVKPSCAGEHMDLLLTVHERSSYLELTCAARFSGTTVRIQLSRVVIASYGLDESEPCSHPLTDQLNPDKARNIMTTSVAAPRAPGARIAIVQTAGNGAAQLLACELGAQPILQRKSCLNCAYDEAVGTYKMIIVG